MSLEIESETEIVVNIFVLFQCCSTEHDIWDHAALILFLNTTNRSILLQSE